MTSGTPQAGSSYAPPEALARQIPITRSDFEGWPVYTVTPRRGEADGQVLFIHGGGYVTQIVPWHWEFAARLAEHAHRTVTVPVYPLAPQHTHRDVFPVLTRLYQELTVGQDMNRFAVAGDSAGATIALALVQSLPPQAARPGDLILLSPWLDATMTNPEIAAIEPLDPMSATADLKALGRAWAGPDAPSIARVSPVNGPLDNLGRVTVYTSTRDILSPDARRLQRLADEAGTSIDLREYQGMLHDWMIMPVPEAMQVMTEITGILSGDAAPAS